MLWSGQLPRCPYAKGMPVADSFIEDPFSKVFGVERGACRGASPSDLIALTGENSYYQWNMAARLLRPGDLVAPAFKVEHSGECAVEFYERDPVLMKMTRKRSVVTHLGHYAGTLPVTNIRSYVAKDTGAALPSAIIPVGALMEVLALLG